MIFASPLIPFTVLIAVVFSLAALTILKPYIIRLFPNDIAGPDGFYFDTRNNDGIFDIFPKSRRD